MKVFLDDERPTPEGWHRTTSVTDTVALLALGVVEELSLDHDLGPVDETGYDVLTWIERMVVEANFEPPIMYVHSANPPARKRMEQAIDAIRRRASGNDAA